MSENGFVKVDWGFGSFESHLAPLVRGWRGLPAVRSYSFLCSKQPPVEGAFAFQVEGAAGWAVAVHAAFLSPWS